MTGGTSFERLVREHHAAVYRAARRIVCDDQDAMDVTQQVFLKAIDATGRLARSDHPDRILRWMAHRTALMHLRSAKSRRARERKAAMTHDASHPPVDFQLHEDRVRLGGLVDELPDDLRVAVVLRYQEELSLSEIAELCACSKSTVQSRLERALSTLRRALVGTAGAASLAADLEAQLALAPPTRVPPSVQEALLQIAVPKFALPSMGTLAALLLAVAGTVAIPLYQSRLSDRESRAPSRPTAFAPLDDEAIASPGDPVTPVVPPPPTLSRRENLVDEPSGEGTSVAPVSTEEVPLRGRLVDAHHDPIAGATVIASSASHQGKFSRVERSSVSNQRGEYELVLPGSESASWYRIWAKIDDTWVFPGVDVELKPGDREVRQDLVTPRPCGVRAGASDLELLIGDSAGLETSHRLVVGANVVLSRLVDGGTHTDFKIEGRGTTDDEGRVRFHSEWLGRKRVDIEAEGGIVDRQEITVNHEGHHRMDLFVSRGGVISGRVTTLEGDPVERLRIHAVRQSDPNGWEFAKVDGTRFEFPSLLNGDYNLHFLAPHRTDVTLVGVAAGANDVAVSMKRLDDPSDRGTHRAEIHGSIRDAMTAAPIEVDWDLDLDVMSIPKEIDRATYERDFLPNHIYPGAYQIGIGPDRPGPSDVFHKVDLEAGRYALRLRAPNSAPTFDGPFDLGPTDVLTDRVLRVSTGGELRGAVTNEAGAIVPNAIVVLTGSGPISDAKTKEHDDEVRKAGVKSTFVFYHERADEEGRFLFKRLPPGIALRVAAFHPDYRPTTSGWVSVGMDRDTDVPLVAQPRPE